MPNAWRVKGELGNAPPAAPAAPAEALKRKDGKLPGSLSFGDCFGGFVFQLWFLLGHFGRVLVVFWWLFGVLGILGDGCPAKAPLPAEGLGVSFVLVFRGVSFLRGNNKIQTIDSFGVNVSWVGF